MRAYASLDRLEKIQFIVSCLLRLTVFFALLFAVYQRNWTIVYASGLALFSLHWQAILERNFQLRLPTEFEFMITLFLYASLFLGEVHSFYERFWWWDIALHTGSGIVLGFVGYMILYSLYIQKRMDMSPFVLSMFTFCFALGFGALWEIFEFAMDQIFGLTMQKSGLVDTMWDLIVDAIGALFVACIGYSYLKFRKTPLSIFEVILKKFFENNPKFRV